MNVRQGYDTLKDFKEVHKSLESLKEQTLATERKLLIAKRSSKLNSQNQYTESSQENVHGVKLAKRSSKVDVNSQNKHSESDKQQHRKVSQRSTREKSATKQKNGIDIENTVPKEIVSSATVEEQPKPAPSKQLFNQNPEELKRKLIKSVLTNVMSKVSSSDPSLSSESSAHKQFSSEATSSFVAKTYKNANKQLQHIIEKHEKGLNKNEEQVPHRRLETDLKIAEHFFGKDQDNREDKSKYADDVARTMYWRPVNDNKPVLLNTSKKAAAASSGFNKTKEVVEWQKKVQAMLQSKNEDEVSIDLVDKHVKSSCTNDSGSHFEVPKPTRKVAVITTLPEYKGFSAYGTNVPTYLHSHSKDDVASGAPQFSKVSRVKNKSLPPRRFKKVVRCDDNIVAPRRLTILNDKPMKDKNAKPSLEQEKENDDYSDHSFESDDDSSHKTETLTSSESSKKGSSLDDLPGATELESKKVTALIEKNGMEAVNIVSPSFPGGKLAEIVATPKETAENLTSSKNGVMSQPNTELESQQHSSHHSKENKTHADEDLSTETVNDNINLTDSPMDKSIQEIPNDSHMTSEATPKLDSKIKEVENFKPSSKRTSVKRKATKPPEQISHSPKIRHYDVNKVRNYIKKKKLERKQRHTEELNQQLEEEQKRKERLKQLYEYQRKHIRALSRKKSISPVKSLPGRVQYPLQVNQAHNVSDLQSQRRVFKKSQRHLRSKSDSEVRLDYYNKHNSTGFQKKSLTHKYKPYMKSGSSSKPNKRTSNVGAKKLSKNSEATKESLKILDSEIQGKGILSDHIANNKKDLHKIEEKNEHSNRELESEGGKKLDAPPSKIVTDLDSSNKQQELDPISDNLISGSLDTSFGLSQLDSSVTNSNVLPLKPGKGALPISSIELRQCESLKNLVETIHHTLKPYEVYLKTKKWVDENHLLSSKKQSVKEPSQKLTSDTNDAHGVQRETSQMSGSSFKEKIAGIGNVTELYNKIMGRKVASEKWVQTAENELQKSPTTTTSEDSIIEGSIISEDKSENSSKFRTTEKRAHSIFPNAGTSLFDRPIFHPDPFNFINTWNRKPLDILLPLEKDDIRKPSLMKSTPKAKLPPTDENIMQSQKTISSDYSLLVKSGKSNSTDVHTYASDFEESEAKSEENITVSKTDSGSSGVKQITPDAVKSKQNMGKEESVIVNDLPERSVSSLESEDLSPSKHSSIIDEQSSREEQYASIIAESIKSESLIESEKTTEQQEEDSESHIKTASKSDSSVSEIVSVVENSKTISNHDVTSLETKNFKSNPPENVTSDKTLHKSDETSEIISNNGKPNITDAAKTLSEESVPFQNEIELILTSSPVSTEMISENVAEIAEENTSLSSSKTGSTENSVASGKVSNAIDNKTQISRAETNNSIKTGSSENISKESISHSAKKELKLISKSSISSKDDSLHTDISEHTLSSEGSINENQRKMSESSNKYCQTSFTPLHEDTAQSSDFIRRQNTDVVPVSSQYDVIVKPDKFRRPNSAAAYDLRHSSVVSMSNMLEKNKEREQNLIPEDQPYFHPHTVTRVVTEAATAAATSAVVAVLETQKALRSRKHLNFLERIGGSSKSGHYSSDFESSESPKTPTEQSLTDTKKSKSISEHMEESKSDAGSISESIHTEKNSTSQENEVESQVEAESSIKSELNGASDNATNDSMKVPPGNSKRKISGNLSSPSPASLSDNDTISSATVVSSNSRLSRASGFSEDSCSQLTFDVIHRMTHEEELRARHQLSLLQFQEKTLVEKARAEMSWLEILKKKLREKGASKKVSAIKKRQKDLILRLRQERAQLKCMQETYRNICEQHRSLLSDKKKLLNEASALEFPMLSKKHKSYKSLPQEKLRDISHTKSASSDTSIVGDEDVKLMVDEVISEVPEVLKSITSYSSQESVIETQASTNVKSLSSSSKSHKYSTGPSLHSKSEKNNSTLSLHSVQSAESAAQGLKKLEASKRHLTKREQRIVQRRKHVESLLQWQMKLDSEEMAVRELEQKALELVDNSKKKSKYYVSSTSPSAAQNEDHPFAQGDSPMITPDKSVSSANDKPVDTVLSLPVAVTMESIPSSDTKNTATIPDEQTFTNTSGSIVEDATSENKNVSHSSKSQSSSPVQEEITESLEASVKTVDTEELENHHSTSNVSEDISNHPSDSPKDKSPSPTTYSDSFESSSSKSQGSTSVSRKSSLPNAKNDIGLNIKPPLVPRNMRRHDSSGSDDSYTISHSETASDQSDIEGRIHALSEELRRRKAEAEKLKRVQKKRYREQLKEKEMSLQKQLEAYDDYIHKTKQELEHQIESANSTQITDSGIAVKPQIKRPHLDSVAEPRRLKKQLSLSPETSLPEKKISENNTSPDSPDSSILSISFKKGRNNMVKPVQDEPKSEEHANNISSAITSELKDVQTEIEEPNNNSSLSTEFLLTAKTSVESTDSNESLQDNATKKLTINKLSGGSDSKYIGKDNESSSHSENKVKHSIHSDSFVSESSESMENHSKESKRPDVSELSNHEKSDDNSVEDIVEDIADSSSSSNKTLLLKSDQSSEDNSLTDAHSVINEGSIEESENENSNQNCENSDGCGSPKKILDATYAVDETRKSLDIPDITQDDLAVELDDATLGNLASPKINLKSETFVMTVVENLFAMVFDDAVKMVLNFSKPFESMHLKSVLPVKTGLTKISETKSKKEKRADAICDELMEMCLEDAMFSFMKIFKKNNLQLAANINHTHPYGKHSKTVSENSKKPSGIFLACIDEVSSKAAKHAFEDNVDFKKPNTLFSKNDLDNESIFNRQAEWFDNDIITHRDAQLQVNDQQPIFQYPYYYRKIPNKPPPPYKPPANLDSTLENFVEPETLYKTDGIKPITDEVNQVVEDMVEVLLEGKDQGLGIKDIAAASSFPVTKKLGLISDSQQGFVDFIFDLVKETSLDIFREGNEEGNPFIKPKRLTPKPLFPKSKGKLMGILQKEVQLMLKLPPAYVPPDHQRKKISWSTMKLGSKKRDFVDTILISELKDEEPDWVNYDEDEVTVKFQIADSIFNVLLDDTVKTIRELENKISRVVWL